jgi:hypothetical protein
MKTEIPVTVSPKPIYEVVSPVGEPTGKELSYAQSMPDLHGKAIGFIWCRMRNGDLLAQALMDLLSKDFRDLKFVRLQSGKGLEWGEYPDESLGDVIREAGINGAIVVIGC